MALRRLAACADRTTFTALPGCSRDRIGRPQHSDFDSPILRAACRGLVVGDRIRRAEANERDSVERNALGYKIPKHGLDAPVAKSEVVFFGSSVVGEAFKLDEVSTLWCGNGGRDSVKRAHVLLAERIRVECKSNRRLISYSVLVHIGDTRFNLSCHCSDLVQSGPSVELGCFSAAVGIGGHSIGSSRHLVGSLSGHGGLIRLGKSCLGSLVDCIKTFDLPCLSITQLSDVCLACSNFVDRFTGKPVNEFFSGRVAWIEPTFERTGRTIGTLFKSHDGLVGRVHSVVRNRQQGGDDMVVILAEYLDHVWIGAAGPAENVCSGRQYHAGYFDGLVELDNCLLVPFIGLRG